MPNSEYKMTNLHKVLISLCNESKGLLSPPVMNYMKYVQMTAPWIYFV